MIVQIREGMILMSYFHLGKGDHMLYKYFIMSRTTALSNSVI